MTAGQGGVQLASQAQQQLANGLNMGLQGAAGLNEGLQFDMNDFPTLTGQNAMRKNAMAHQNTGFNIQSEDFPALPGMKGAWKCLSRTLCYFELTHFLPQK